MLRRSQIIEQDLSAAASMQNMQTAFVPFAWPRIMDHMDRAHSNGIGDIASSFRGA
jgi:ABC-type anion transport system duplicated permease subunit